VKTITEEKRQVREQIRKRQIAANERARFSQLAVEILSGRAEWREARTILAYLPLQDELDLMPALKTALAGGKTIALPQYIPEHGKYVAAILEGPPENLRKGKFGVMEPSPDAPRIPLNRLDFVLAPGVAFDPDGHRLGRGRGFYDRLLAEVTGVKCGVALDEQIVPKLPVEAHDIPMDYILTPSRWLQRAPAGNS
jgi:5-formyltetrahydrofolate cyclo-ligase